jgi:micrococcal nuclease
MAKRKRMLGTVLTLVLVVAVAWYLNRDAFLSDAPPPGGAAATAEETVTSDPTQPCHVYEEHRKVVQAAAEVPVLKDQKASAYKVLEVVDGDTIVIDKNGKTTVRLLAMDTPEKSKTRYGYVEYFGEEAWRHALKLVEASGNEVRVTYDKTKKDKYDRDLAYVWLKDGRMLNALMVADGYAYSYTSSPKPEWVDTMLALMRQARDGGKGLWGHCE